MEKSFVRRHSPYQSLNEGRLAGPESTTVSRMSLGAEGRTEDAGLCRICSEACFESKSKETLRLYVWDGGGIRR